MSRVLISSEYCYAHLGYLIHRLIHICVEYLWSLQFLNISVSTRGNLDLYGPTDGQNYATVSSKILTVLSENG